MLSLCSLIRTIYIYIAPLLVKNSKAFSKIYTKNYIYFTEYSHRWNENQQLWSSAEGYTTVANKTQSKPLKNPKQKTTEMPDASVGKGDVSMQTATCTSSVCALRTRTGWQQTYFIMIKATDFIHVQFTAFWLLREILRINCKSIEKNEPGTSMDSGDD